MRKINAGEDIRTYVTENDPVIASPIFHKADEGSGKTNELKMNRLFAFIISILYSIFCFDVTAEIRISMGKTLKLQIWCLSRFTNI